MAIRFSPSAVTALIAMLSAAVLVSACGQPPGPPPGSGPQPTPQVGFVIVQPQRVALTTELPGRTAPVLIAEVRPQVTGLIQSRRFTEGSEVKAGELLYQIDPATYRASVASAEAALAKAEANLVSTRLKAGRYKELAAIQAVSGQDADDAAAALLQGEADVASARAALQTARINLDYTRVTAPIGGRIGRSSVTPGALVTAAQPTALATVQKLDPMYVDVTQASAALLRLRAALAKGDLSAGTARVRLLLEDGSAYPLEGRLQFSDVTVDQASGAVTLRAQFPNPKGVLLPGMYVRAVVEEGVVDKALLAPQQAVARDGSGKPSAKVVGADGKVQQRAIVTTRAVGDQWLVASGLQAGDRLVVEGGQKAAPGAAVQVVPYRTAEGAVDPAAGVKVGARSAGTADGLARPVRVADGAASAAAAAAKN